MVIDTIMNQNPNRILKYQNLRLRDYLYLRAKLMFPSHNSKKYSVFCRTVCDNHGHRLVGVIPLLSLIFLMPKNRQRANFGDILAKNMHYRNVIAMLAQ